MSRVELAEVDAKLKAAMTAKNYGEVSLLQYRAHELTQKMVDPESRSESGCGRSKFGWITWSKLRRNLGDAMEPHELTNEEFFKEVKKIYSGVMGAKIVNGFCATEENTEEGRHKHLGILLADRFEKHDEVRKHLACKKKIYVAIFTPPSGAHTFWDKLG